MVPAGKGSLQDATYDKTKLSRPNIGRNGPPSWPESHLLPFCLTQIPRGPKGLKDSSSYRCLSMHQVLNRQPTFIIAARQDADDKTFKFRLLAEYDRYISSKINHLCPQRVLNRKASWRTLLIGGWVIPHRTWWLGNPTSHRTLSLV